jgi:hypothetical protein
MPTPIMHLDLADTIIRRGDLEPEVQQLLAEQRGPFLLGNTAPDVKSVSGQRRQETHFYSIHHNSGAPAVQALLAAHPALREPAGLAPAHAAFVAGYVAHLTLDELWLEQVYRPYFVGSTAESLRQGAFAHNVLRTWLDRRALEGLDRGVAEALRRAEPDRWLPFTEDSHLRSWRDWLVQQLSPGHSVQTAAVFAERMGVPVEEVEAVLGSETGMEEQVFTRMPRSAVAAFEVAGYERCVAQIHSYLGVGTAGGQE